MMRAARGCLKETNRSSYLHVTNRLVEGMAFLTDDEKAMFVDILKSVAAGLQIKILTYCVMGDHFHALVHVPASRLVSDAEWWTHLKLMHSGKRIQQMQEQWDRRKADGDGAAVLKEMQALKGRMHHIEPFMQSLQIRFSKSLNKQRRRRGTLWQSCYRSVLIEGRYDALSKVMAYVDLNPVRAGLCDDPKAYAFSAYGSYYHGCRAAKKAYVSVYALDHAVDDSGRKAWAEYRKLLFGVGARKEQGAITGSLSRKVIRQAFKDGTPLSMAQLLRCRVRHMSGGLVLGSKDFLDAYLDEHRDVEAWASRKVSGHKLPGGDWGDFLSFRQLVVDPMEVT